MLPHAHSVGLGKFGELGVGEVVHIFVPPFSRMPFYPMEMNVGKMLGTFFA